MERIKSRQVCFDVGSNFGYYACLMAALVGADGRVVAFEADPFSFAFTRDNAFINWYEGRIWAHNKAISEKQGELTLYRRLVRSGNTSIGQMTRAELEWLGEEEAPAFKVEATTIDANIDLVGGRIDFVKIDVEGAELLVLRGMRNSVKRCPDITVVMEWSPWQLERAGFNASDLLDEIDMQGLRMAFLDGAGLRPIGRDQLLATTYGTVVLTHSGRRDTGSPG